MSMTALQAAAFLIALFTGFLLGALYAASDSLKKKLPKGALRLLCDAVYYLLFFCASTAVFYETGSPRGFCVLGFLCGFALYWLGVGALIKFFAAKYREKKDKRAPVSNK